MLKTDTVISNWKDGFIDINGEIFKFTVVKEQVDEWIEANVYISESTSVRPGFYSFDFTPYMREPVRCLHPSDVTRFVSIMKDGQSGFTTALVIGGILYIMKVTPDGILFTASDITLAAKTIEERFDPVVRSSKLEHMIRPHVIKKSNNRTGDTTKKKEFIGGTMTTAGTASANTFRMFSAKYIFADDYDTAPKEIGKEGSPKAVMKARQNSFGDKAKTFMISTPTVTQTSNIWEQYQLGTQEKWNWLCPACDEPFPVDWRIALADGTFAGIVWEVDENKKLILDSVRFKCPHCGHLIEEKEKYDLNLAADKDPRAGWVATVPIPKERRHRSFQKNFIYNPPGFDGWVTGVEEWIAANPPGEPANVLLLKTFNNLRLGLPFEEQGSTLKATKLMANTRQYHPGIVPDMTCEADGNGKIIMLTLAVDINGIYKPDENNEDVRIDWEIVAHSSGGPTYSIDQGSIGTFKRTRDAGNKDAASDEVKREKWTLTHNVDNSVWPELKTLILNDYKTEREIAAQLLEAEALAAGKITLSEVTGVYQGRNIHISVIDTGFGEKQAMQFITDMQADQVIVFGVKGLGENEYRPLKRDSNPVNRSKERPKQLYNVDVNQIKNDLSKYMEMRAGGDDGAYQPRGFMNYPEPRDGKYSYAGFFKHYESEIYTEQKSKGGDAIGYMWKKKNNQIQNHFWDVRVYNLAAPLVYLDVFKRYSAKFKDYTWEDFVQYCLE